MYLDVAVGCLAHQLPDCLKTVIARDDQLSIFAASGSRRKHELEWSRGLKAGLVKKSAEFESHGQENRFKTPTNTSITHDKYYTAVARTNCVGIGIDVQSDRSFESCQQISDYWFPDLERAEILESNDCTRFLKSWVVKESWAKCMNKSIFDACREVAVWGGKCMP